jgi:pimeloyl-ACP methyl ester carboxylesterase
MHLELIEEAAMTLLTESPERTQHTDGDARSRLLAGLPVKERRLKLAGVSTAILEGGDSPPVVLLHGPGEFAARWMRVIPDLVETHHVIAPDLPGHGASEVIDGRLTGDRVLTWLAELIERTCSAPPALVGHLLGGSIAARFASVNGDRLSRLVLVDTFGLTWLRPAPRFAISLIRAFARPTERNYERFMRYCAFDRDALRQRMGERWDALRAYALDRARAPSVKAAMRALMPRLGIPPIPAEDLARITVPTTLIWGRHDLATRLEVAEAASARYGWPLRVIENAAEALLEALRAALGSR